MPAIPRSIRRTATRLVRHPLRLTLLLPLLLLLAPPAHANRQIPVGVYNVNNSALSQGPSRIYAVRFVLDRPARIHRFYGGVNWEGVYVDENNRPAPAEIRSSTLNKGRPMPPAPSNLPSGWTPGTGRTGYAHGNGGTIRARLVPMRANGTPDLANVLAEDTYQAVKRYKQIKSEWGFAGRAGMVYSNFGGAQVQAGVPHFVLYQNVDPDPRNNFVGMQSPVVSKAAAGPNGANTLDPNAPGAMNGLDPREAVAWSLDGGASWGWGQDVGGGPIPGDYTMTGDNAVRLPWYAWQEGPNAPLHSHQPYYAYTARGSYTLRVKSAPRAVTLTEAGGYAPSGGSVGVVTVKNLRTGAVGRTSGLGTGLAKGKLSPPVAIAAGDTYEISNSGSVAKAEGDEFLQRMGLVGPGKTPYETVGHGYDRAELFALPHPWFGMQSSPPSARKPKPSAAKVYIERVSALARRASSPDNRESRRTRHLQVAGGLTGAAAGRRKVIVQAFQRGSWRVVAAGRLRDGRFTLHASVRVLARRGGLKLRAVMHGVGRSRVALVQLRRL